MAVSEKEIRELNRLIGADRIRRNVRLAPFTTFKIGGPAELFSEPESADELADVIQASRNVGIPYFLLGLGANILVGDGGVPGLVIRNTTRAFHIDRKSARLTADSGAIVWPDIIQAAVEAGLSGLEHFAGIPSTVGGALWQNLHFLSPPPERERTIYIEEVLDSAEILTPEGNRKSVPTSYFEFGYDQSTLHRSGDIVLSASFQLQPGDPSKMKEIIEANLSWRRHRHPPLNSEPSAGSIFKKIEGIGAGRLIDECGLKGLRIGGAEITHRHANIVVNRGKATAADVRALIDQTVETVLKETGVSLEPEITFIGEF